MEVRREKGTKYKEEDISNKCYILSSVNNENFNTIRTYTIVNLNFVTFVSLNGARLWLVL